MNRIDPDLRLVGEAIVMALKEGRTAGEAATKFHEHLDHRLSQRRDAEGGGDDAE